MHKMEKEWQLALIRELLEELNQISEFHIAFGKVLYDKPQEYFDVR